MSTLLENDEKDIDDAVDEIVKFYSSSEGKDLILCECAQDADIEGMRNIIDKGADVNTKNKDGITPLHFAAFSGSIDASKILMDAGANINAKGNNLATPIFFAISSHSVDIVKILIEGGAAVNHKMKRGVTPLDVAKYWRSYDIIKILEDAGAIKKKIPYIIQVLDFFGKFSILFLIYAFTEILMRIIFQ